MPIYGLGVYGTPEICKNLYGKVAGTQDLFLQKFVHCVWFVNVYQFESCPLSLETKYFMSEIPKRKADQ